ncbi:protein of unknown function (DU1801) [Belliella baltica DSM 15883]|uniref:YdhG-like domain-containing protein n=1 Tax=Belliella baltica (strain DSM 15883 / CIP 108006 / LMG 21964 / BA134) TaxID=866536 RepID=I3Z693_BELBD|nr:DUF1801 domain-containing protein [Belliella baltica]AFL84761.1 protein of unknown function (DU1801) [Belliella baltica DSM 15883]
MAELKTQENDANVKKFIHEFANSEQKITDSLILLDLMEKVTGFEPKMWGPSIIGFGKYHYKSERSKQEGDWPLVGFSPRKTAISLYIYSGGANQDDLLNKLGKFKMGKGCIYVKKLSDIDPEILKKMVLSTMDFLQKKYGKLG